MFKRFSKFAICVCEYYFLYEQVLIGSTNHLWTIQNLQKWIQTLKISNFRKFQNLPFRSQFPITRGRIQLFTEASKWAKLLGQLRFQWYWMVKTMDIENELSDISQKNKKNMPAGGLRQLMFFRAPSSKPITYYSSSLLKQLYELYTHASWLYTIVYHAMRNSIFLQIFFFF